MIREYRVWIFEYRERHRFGWRVEGGGRGATVSRPWVQNGRGAGASLPCAAKPRAVSGKRLAVGSGKHSGLRFPLERYASRHLPPGAVTRHQRMLYL